MTANPDQTSTTASLTTRLYNEYVHLSNGEQAELRRGTIGGPFWRLLGSIGKQDAHVNDVQKWQLLVRCLAIAGHNSKKPLGNALKQAGYSEARMKRLLESDADALPGMLRRTARQLKSAGHTGDWNIIRRILFDYKGDADKARIKLAQDYFTHSPDENTPSADSSNNETTSTDE